MIDTLLVSIVVLAAAIYVGIRFYRQFFSGTASCGCSGCGKQGNCGSIQSTPDVSCCSSKDQ